MTKGLTLNLAGSVAIYSGPWILGTHYCIAAGGRAAISARRGPDNADEAIAGKLPGIGPNGPETARKGWLTK